ncbi:MAG: PAS domain S-box protein [Deltaproteobacteria bacterium]|nr:PAS domain S-box protein [Deltaproteobacteria bacterium]
MAASPSGLTDLLTDYRDFTESIEQGERNRRDMMAFVDRLPDGVSFQDGRRVVYANSAMLEILGRDASEVIGHSVFEFIHPDDHGDTEERLALKDDYPDERVDVRIRRPDGSTVITTLQRGQWVDFEGRRVRLTVCRDVTEARRMQAQLMQSDRMASLGTLAAGVAHEINNPLAWLHNAALALDRDIGRLSSEEPPTRDEVERMRESVSAALEGTSRVRMIVQDLRTFSRPDDESVESVDVRDVLRGAIRVSSKELSSRAEVREDYGDVPRVIGNSARLGQVFLNLILNAAQAVDQGATDKSEVGVRAYQDGENVVVEVQDAGRGIPGHLLPRIFEPFFTTKGGDGTGLGLAISHRIVTRLGGRIEVESVEGEGTLFRVVLCAVPSSLSGLQ